MFSIIVIFYFATAFAGEAIIIDGTGKSRAANSYPQPPKYTSPKISVDFQNADIHSVMRFFARTGNTNIIVDEQIQGTITMRLEGVHWEEAFWAVLWSKGLTATSMPSMFLISQNGMPKP